MNVETMPLVSVLISAYNHAGYVEECLTSIAASDYPRIELLIIDDGSTDETFQRICEWRARNSSAYERFVASTRENRGLNATLNELIRASVGELICPFGSDDRILPDGISVRAAALKGDPDLWAVFGDCNVIDQDGVETHKSGFELNSADVTALSVPSTLATELVWRWSVPGPVLMVRREVFFSPDGYGFYPEHRKVEDREFYLWALASRRLGFVNVQVASYRLHGSNTSRILSALTEAQNKDAEWGIAAQFPLPLRLALRLKCLLYRLNASQPQRNLMRSRLQHVAKLIDWRLTRFVLGRNSRRARLGARHLHSRTLQNMVAPSPNQATIDRGL